MHHSKPPQRLVVRLYSLKFLFAVAIAIGINQPVSAQEPSDDDAVEEIVVTGSRLVRNRDLVAVSPITTVDSEQIRASGNVTLESTLNEFPQLNPDNTSTTNWSGGDGILSADLRGLGAVRTLVLVDGRRFIPGSVTGLVDMATIPDMLVERVEIITGGASAVYGSDAIAGAINFILRDDFDGAELRYQYGVTGEDDGASNKFDLIMGTKSADERASITVHTSYTDRDPIFMGDRWFSQQPLLTDSNGKFVEFGSGNIPGGKIFIPASDFSLIQGVDLVAAEASCPGPIQGIRFGANSEPLPFCRPTDQYNYAAPNYLQRPLERWQVSAIGSYNLSTSIEAFSQIFYTKKDNAFQQAALAIAPTSSGEESGRLLLPNADSNPLFPLPLQEFFAANAGYFDPDNDGVFVTDGNGRRFEEFGPRNVTILQDSLSITAGLRGDLELRGRNWIWDTFYQFQRSDLNETRVGLLSQSRTTFGLDVILENGEPSCRVQALGCVPINVYGTNTLTPEMVDYLTVTSGRADTFERRVVGGSIAGTIFEIPTGDVSTAFGFEYRDEFFSTQPDEISSSGDLGGVPPQSNAGDFDLYELFAEARVPILDSLALEGAIRSSDYSTIGSVTTWRAGLDWAPVDWGRLRVSQSRAIRAPNLNELFESPGENYRPAADPCVIDNNPSPEVRQLCLQQGVPANVVDNLQAPASRGWNESSGGNPNLEEEESDTITFGFVLTPPVLEGLSVSVDYFQVEIDNAITRVDSQTQVNACFDSLDINSAPCQVITRNSLGNIERVEAPLLNVARREVAGYDLQIRYGMELPSYLALPRQNAQLDLQFVSTWQTDDNFVLLPGEPGFDCAGKLGAACSSNTVRATPDFRGLLSASWRSGPAIVRAQMQMIGDMKAADDAGPNINIPIDPYYYWDLNARYTIGDSIEVFAGVNNLFDEDPPLLGTAYGNANTQVQLYDALGRRFFLGTTVGFGGR